MGEAKGLMPRGKYLFAKEKTNVKGLRNYYIYIYIYIIGGGLHP
jgi:hypothetical protein